MSISINNQVTLNPNHHDSPAAVKFALYLKTREILQINHQLQEVSLMDKKTRYQWLDQHEEMINQLLASFMDDSMLVMNGIELDREGMKMATQLMINLRDAINLVRSLLYGRKRMKS
ncbi:MAG: hypothetical protein GF390_03545 [Candidatus Pacebacteria bacterium]|nr:hypothetical protein [Candidatus Paceibacterota bacterium]